MRFMFIRRADKLTEAGAPPAPGVFDAMEKYHQEMAAAGILLDGVGLKPSRFGARIAVSGSGKHTRTDGPFAETKELIAGFTMVNVGSREEAIAWAMKWPAIDASAEIEVRPLYEEEDFAQWER
jgi:PhnB protein